MDDDSCGEDTTGSLSNARFSTQIRSFMNRAQIKTEKLVDNISPNKLHLSVNPKKRSSISSIASMTAPSTQMSYKIHVSEKRAQEELEEYLEQAPKFIIHPYSNFRIFWDLTTFAIVTINMAVIPMNIAFYSKENTFDTLFLFSDLWFIADILLNLRTGVVLDDVEMEVVFDPVAIRKAYVSSWFWVDLLSSIPWEIFINMIVQATNDNELENAHALTFTRFLKILTILKLLRITRLAKAIRNWEELLNFQYNISNEAGLKIFQMMFIMSTVIHCNGCILFMVPMFMKFPDAAGRGYDDPQYAVDPLQETGLKDSELIQGPCWVYLRGLIDAAPSEQYAWSIFKAASHMLCIGYGQAPPQCAVDMWISVTTMLAGSVTFAIMIAEITSLIQSMNSSSSAYKEKLTQVKEYMDFCKVPQHLRTRIREYYEVKFQGKMFNEMSILDELNPLLREMINFNCRSLVKSVDFLSAADPDFVYDLIAKLKFEVYLQEDEIIKEGSVGNNMFFINSGTVQVTTKSHMKPRYLSEGEHFGEICLFISNLKRTASIIATTSVSVYTLNADDFNETLKWYPSEKIEMQRVAIERMEILLLQSKYKRNKSHLKPGHITDEFQDFTAGELDDDIYAELEAQRDALVMMHKKREEAEQEKLNKADTANTNKDFLKI